MDKQYDPKSLEAHWQSIWDEASIGEPSPNATPFSMMFPPPNVTGSLHMGHGFLITVSDIYIRYQRMKKQSVLWQMGTDHAGIATQLVVWRQCEKEGIDPRKLGRSAFLEKIENWVKKVKIHDQIKTMGASVDWSTAMFTMDENHSHAVISAFVKMYRDQVIYKGKRLSNWDYHLKTAISDLEVENREEKGFLYHIKYPFVNGDGFITVATTRPETLLGDAAVAVHPDDKRFDHTIQLSLPLTDRVIPVIKDDYVDREFGTGCVKITPAHDFNDYEVGLRHQLPMMNIMTLDGRLNEDVPKRFQGLRMDEARKQIVEELKQQGLLESVQEHIHTVPYCERSGVKIEPLLTDQWFVKMDELSKVAKETVQKKEVELVPNHWEKTYHHFLDHIQDWCISRQIWWGHRIPAWYDNNDHIYVGYSEEDVRSHYQLDDSVILKQDEDVLDTWFSSSLYPFSSLGWPNETERLDQFFPNSLLVTGFDILFFWVTRMIVMSKYLTGKAPFKKVFLHGLVKDEKGQKMSKSKGNVIDPIDLITGISLEALIEKRTQGMMLPKHANQIKQQTQKSYPQGIEAHGTDALRMCFAASATPGRDIRFNLEKLKGYKFFCNKLWNATRFLTMLQGEFQPTFTEKALFEEPIDAWILSQFNTTLMTAEKHLLSFRFDLLAQCWYEFIWHQFCDWYIEFVKINVQNAPSCSSFTAAHLILEKLLRALHPIMPFLTESLWQIVTKPLNRSVKTISTLPYPEPQPIESSTDIASISWAKHMISAIRTLRAECNIAPSKLIQVQLSPFDQKADQQLKKVQYLISKLCNASEIKWVEQPDEICAQTKVDQIMIDIPLKGMIDAQLEFNRISKSIEKTTKSLDQLHQKLNNAKFLDHAPTELVEKEKLLLEEQVSKMSRLKTQLNQIEKLL
ncbi:MAG: valine--tRNA ligase [Legionellales bacterium]|nr:valine--tRNA ligase [Legionellales bacterium]OUX67347.1 MAG: valine--tRNA ligase [bacterium TMED178]